MFKNNFNANIRLTNSELSKWADDRDTSTIVAHAIHMISVDEKKADTLWQEATDAELNAVKNAMRYLLKLDIHGYEEDDYYQWGIESITLEQEK